MNKESVIRKFALQNAVQYKGRSNPGSIIGKVLAEYPDWKKDMKNLMPLIQKVCAEVNKKTIFEQTEELKQTAPELLEKQVKGHDPLKPLHNVEAGKVVMRIEPSPSGTLHVGHSIPLLWNSEYCRKYSGKLILRISDTNPDNIDPDCYTLIEQDARWVTEDNISSVVIQSERMEIYYQKALTLLERGHAYVCTCSSEEFRELYKKMTPCPCRELGEKQNIERWHKMFTDFKDGDAVVRLKTDIRHKNPALRDFPILRINTNEHPRQKLKYRVWPLMNFSVAVDDHELGLTHVLRGKDHFDNTKRQMYIYNYMDWNPPEFIHHGIVNFAGMKLSASETRKMIAEGAYSGWDDIQLPFLQAMKKRGYHPEAFKKFVLSLGLTLSDKTVDAKEFFKNLNFYNREIVEPKAKRFFFIENPKEITVHGAPKQVLELDLHPSNMKKGRKFATTENFLISEEDMDSFKDDDFIRLMDCLNFQVKGEDFAFDSLDYSNYKEKGSKIIHWLPVSKEVIPVEVLMDTGRSKIGVAESNISSLKEGDIIQFERMFFARLIEKGEQYKFYYLHN